MTACTNNGGSRARRAVTAALVGVLSVGAAPMVALATTGDSGVQLMATGESNITKGEVEYKSGEPGQTFVYNGEKQGIVPSSVKPTVGDKLDLTLAPSNPSTREDGAYYYYVKIDSSTTAADGKVEYVDASGKTLTLQGVTMFEMPTDAGSYAVVVGTYTKGYGWDYVKTADTFTISSHSLEGATLYEGDDVDDTTFEWTGKDACNTIAELKKTVHVALNGVALPDDAYDIAFYQGGKQVNDFLKADTDYTVLISGKKGYAGKEVQVPFHYGKMNLSTAEIVAVVGNKEPGANLADVVASINGVEYDDLQSGAVARIQVDYVSGPNDQVSGGKGAYTFKVSAVKDFEGDASGNDWVEGEQTVTVYNANYVATVNYGGTQMATKHETNLSDLKNHPYFDPSKISVVYNGGTEELGSDQYTVKYYNAEGKEVSADALKSAGKYTVVVEVNTKVDGDLVVGKATCEVTVGYGDLTQAADAFLAIDGKNVNGSDSVEYTGEDFADTMEVKVVAGDKTLVAGTDYEVSVSKLNVATGVYDAVDSMTDAGDYKVTIKGITCTFGGQQSTVFDVKVTPAEIEAAEVKYSLFSDKDGKLGFLPYTGEEITPTFVFYTDTDKKEAIEVPASAYEVSYKYGNASGSKDAELKDVCEDGYTYTASFEDALRTDNFDFDACPDVEEIVVSDAKVFVDVPNGEWYTDSVYTAYHQGYIVGIGGTEVFAPLQSMSRADLVCVLYRMAGGDASEGANQEDQSWLSDFEDVDVHAYYAKAVAWATKVGVAKGYGTTFGTERLVSTEEFVTMLARYAKLMGTDTSVDTEAVLAKVADGDKVGAPYRDSVAWAVEQGYVAKDGNLIDPQGSVYRGRVVTIAVRYQPEQANLINGAGRN